MRGIICISSDSDPNSCVFDDEITSITAYYPNRVIWKFLPGKNLDDKKSFIQNLEEMISDKEMIDSWSEEVAENWKLINKYEVIEYYLYLLNQRGFAPKQIGERTHAVFENLLNDFSIAQIEVES